MAIYHNLKVRIDGVKTIGVGLVAKAINEVECAIMGEPWTAYERNQLINRHIIKGVKQVYSR